MSRGDENAERSVLYVSDMTGEGKGGGGGQKDTPKIGKGEAAAVGAHFLGHYSDPAAGLEPISG